MKISKNLDKTEVAFLFSNYYSGATLLAFFLNNHNKLVCNGETFPYEHSETDLYKCSCGETIKNCRFYKYAADQFHLNDSSREEQQYFSILPSLKSNKFLNKFIWTLSLPSFLRKALLEKISSLNKEKELFLKLHSDFIKKACQYYNASIYVDNTKSIQRYELFLNNFDRKIKAIHLVRDGRAFFHSYKKNNPNTLETPKFIAHKWQGYLNEVSRLQLHNPAIQILNIRYEDLCENPVATIRKICEFLSIENDENILKKQQCEHHILGNKMRFDFDWSFKKDTNTAWQNELTKDEITLCNTLQKNGLKTFSYRLG